jgi:hypothetical protein
MSTSAIDSTTDGDDAMKEWNALLLANPGDAKPVWAALYVTYLVDPCVFG